MGLFNTQLYQGLSLGAIVEMISGLFFRLYSKSLKQINIFHKSLQGTQEFLTAIQLVEKISESNRDSAYAYIIQEVIRSEHPVPLPNANEKKS